MPPIQALQPFLIGGLVLCLVIKVSTPFPLTGQSGKRFPLRFLQPGMGTRNTEADVPDC